MKKRKLLTALAVIVAGSFIFSELSHAWIVAAASAAKRRLNKMQNQNKQEDVMQITYDQLMQTKNSNEGFVLVDVLSPESYAQGHIEGAISFPLNTINKESAAKALPKDAKIIVYCASFQCSASTEAANKLSALGYDVVDYKGGLKDWQENGNKLVK